MLKAFNDTVPIFVHAALLVLVCYINRKAYLTAKSNGGTDMLCTYGYSR